MAWVGNFGDNGIDHGHIQDGGHAIVQKAGVHHGAVWVVKILLVQGPADALDSAALHLPLHVAGMHGFSRVDKSRAAQDIDLAGFGVHPYVDDIAGDNRADPRGIDADGASDGAAGTHEPAGQFFEGQPVVGIPSADKRAVLEFHVFRLNLPDQSCPSSHLALNLFRRGNGGQSGVEGSAAAPGGGGVADGVGVHHGRPHVLGPQSQHLGSLHGHGCAGTTDVHRAGYKVNGAVIVHVDSGRRGLASLPAEAHGHAPPGVGSLQRSAVMGMGHHSLFHLPAAKHGVRDPGGHPVTFFDSVLQPEFHGIHTQLFGQLVDDGLDGEAALGLARRAVGLHFLLVANNVISVHQKILYVVGPCGAQCSAAHRRPWVGASFVGHV